MYAGYQQFPLKWIQGTEPTPIAWYAGKEWDTDMADAQKMVTDLSTYNPEAGSFKLLAFSFGRETRTAMTQYTPRTKNKI
jgi:hypothetical protein